MRRDAGRAEGDAPARRPRDAPGAPGAGVRLCARVQGHRSCTPLSHLCRVGESRAYAAPGGPRAEEGAEREMLRRWVEAMKEIVRQRVPEGVKDKPAGSGSSVGFFHALLAPPPRVDPLRSLMVVRSTSIGSG